MGPDFRPDTPAAGRVEGLGAVGNCLYVVRGKNAIVRESLDEDSGSVVDWARVRADLLGGDEPYLVGEGERREEGMAA